MPNNYKMLVVELINLKNDRAKGGHFKLMQPKVGDNKNFY